MNSGKFTLTEVFSVCLELSLYLNSLLTQDIKFAKKIKIDSLRMM